MFARVQLIDDNRIASILETRFQSEIRDLEVQGFVSDGVLEIRHSLPLLPTAIVFGLVGREVWKWEFPFSVNWYHPVMRSQDGTSVAYPFGIGVRYYTFFDDGSTQRTSACQDEELFQYRKHCNLFVANLKEKVISKSWLRHLAFVEKHTNEGKNPLRTDNINRLVAMQTEEDSWLDIAVGCLLGWGGISIALLLVNHLIQG